MAQELTRPVSSFLVLKQAIVHFCCISVTFSLKTYSNEQFCTHYCTYFISLSYHRNVIEIFQFP
jgi:hypothetical protein